MKPNETTDKKLQQFIEELNTLSARYQYQLKAEVTYTSEGILPKITVINVPPKKETKKGKP